jgi:transposase
VVELVLSLLQRLCSSEQIIEFLGALRRMIGRKLRVIWHGVGCQKSRQVRQWLEAHNGQIAIAFLPPQALDLNPVKAILAYLKKQEIAKVCPTTLTEAGDFARWRLMSMQCRPKLTRAFWQQTELALWIVMNFADSH